MDTYYTNADHDIVVDNGQIKSWTMTLPSGDVIAGTATDYSYSIPSEDARYLRADQTWQTALNSDKEKIKELEENIEQLKNQMSYVLNEIERMKTRTLVSRSLL